MITTPANINVKQEILDTLKISSIFQNKSKEAPVDESSKWVNPALGGYFTSFQQEKEVRPFDFVTVRDGVDMVCLALDRIHSIARTRDKDMSIEIDAIKERLEEMAEKEELSKT